LTNACVYLTSSADAVGPSTLVPHSQLGEIRRNFITNGNGSSESLLGPGQLHAGEAGGLGGCGELIASGSPVLSSAIKAQKVARYRSRGWAVRGYRMGSTGLPRLGVIHLDKATRSQNYPHRLGPSNRGAGLDPTTDVLYVGVFVAWEAGGLFVHGRMEGLACGVRWAQRMFRQGPSCPQ
jgi:hypothetical protein